MKFRTLSCAYTEEGWVRVVAASPDTSLVGGLAPLDSGFPRSLAVSCAGSTGSRLWCVPGRTQSGSPLGCGDYLLTGVVWVILKRGLGDEEEGVLCLSIAALHLYRGCLCSLIREVQQAP